MSQHSINLDINKNICEGFGCLAVATTQITVKVGQQSTISLRLCKDCVLKFKDNNRKVAPIMSTKESPNENIGHRIKCKRKCEHNKKKVALELVGEPEANTTNKISSFKEIAPK
jgi:hypothetical protein